jgi:hypothetical protein
VYHGRSSHTCTSWKIVIWAQSSIFKHRFCWSGCTYRMLPCSWCTSQVNWILIPFFKVMMVCPKVLLSFCTCKLNTTWDLSIMYGVHRGKWFPGNKWHIRIPVSIFKLHFTFSQPPNTLFESQNTREVYSFIVLH